MPRPRHVVTALAGVASIEAAVALAAELRWALPEVLALEMMTGPSLRLVAEHLGAPPPVAPGAGAYLLVEAGGAEDPLPHLAAALDGRPEVADAAVATERRLAASLAEAYPRSGLSASCTSSSDCRRRARQVLPRGRRAGRRRPEPDAAVRPRRRQMHVNVAGPAADDEEVDDLVLALVVERGGSISAEHGIGTLKRRWLERDRSPAEVAAMRAVKRALDPDGVLNPHAVLPGDGPAPVSGPGRGSAGPPPRAG